MSSTTVGASLCVRLRSILITVGGWLELGLTADLVVLAVQVQKP
jgi:hypothetical protein